MLTVFLIVGVNALAFVITYFRGHRAGRRLIMRQVAEMLEHPDLTIASARGIAAGIRDLLRQ